MPYTRHTAFIEGWEQSRLRPCAGCRWNGNVEHIFRVPKHEPRSKHGHRSMGFLDPELAWVPSEAPCISCDMRRGLIETAKAIDGGSVNIRGGRVRVWNPQPGRFIVGNTRIIDDKIIPEGPKFELDVFVPGNKSSGAQRRVLASPAETKYADDAIAFARSKLHACKRHHRSKQCGPLGAVSDPTYRPRRLVCIRSGGKWRTSFDDDGLVSVVPMDKIHPGCRYAALSYCGGNGTDPLPVEAAADASETGDGATYRVGSLPALYRDAVEVTRRLGLEYLYIDALCLAPGNDDGDKRVEEHEIFLNSHVVLAALHGNDKNGLFPSPPWRKPVENIACIINRPRHFKLVDLPQRFSRYQEVIARPLNLALGGDIHGDALMHSAPEDLSHEEPLLSRAWALQERLISMRTIFFGRHEVIWECRSKTSCQCRGDVDGHLTKKQVFYDALIGSVQKGDSAARRLEWDWRAIVMRYSCIVKDPCNLLIGVGGIARCVSDAKLRLGGQDGRQPSYLAGLWGDTIVADLMWCAVNTIKVKDLYEHSSPCIPSLETVMFGEKLRVKSPLTWSWTSVARTMPVSWIDKWVKTARRPLASFICAEIDSGQGDEFGNLTSGKITLRAPLVQCRISPVRWTHEIMAEVKVERRWTMESEVWLDPRKGEWKGLLEDRGKGNFSIACAYLVLLGVQRKPESPEEIRLTALLVGQTGNRSEAGSFRRLGFVGIYDGRQMVEALGLGSIKGGRMRQVTII